MDLSDVFLLENRDWDPYYLKELVEPDFHDFTEHWCSNVNDTELVSEMKGWNIIILLLRIFP